MKIGIIGGGQLGMMMAEAAHKNNHYVVGLDPHSDCPLRHVADEMICASYDDKTAFDELVNKVDVMTYEFENVDIDLVEEYAFMFPQKAQALTVSKHRFTEKEFAQSLNIPTPQFHMLTDIKSIVPPVILKTTTGGYDGKGQYIVQTHDDLNQTSIDISQEIIVEEYIDFDYEISCIVTRDLSGECAFQPLPRNTHKEGILWLSDVTEPLPITVVKQAKSYTKSLVDTLDYVGTLAVEFFVKDNMVIFNEFAPRPHNSGHFSIEGTTVSQFDNHILAMTGEKVKMPTQTSPTLMLNILGEDLDYLKYIKDIPFGHIHMYHKTDARPKRKMGHVTFVHNNSHKLITEITTLIEAMS
ncbi:MAG: 5-(carboxyamino)imidazole ribonucleotide synthase [Candidatus Izemoplasma sp.]|nr:5-(carboxyamino)imidazole ribonucleotide synthase [Candidatus Izemoplasma sp.]